MTDKAKPMTMALNVDVSTALGQLKKVNGEARSLVGNLAQVSKGSRLDGLSNGLAKATSSASTLGSALAGVSKQLDHISQTNVVTGPTAQNTISPPVRLVNTAQYSPAYTRKMREVSSGLGLSEDQIHENHLTKLSRHLQDTKDKATASDLKQLFSATHDTWERQASGARDRYHKDVSAGVDPKLAQKTLDAKIAKIRAERDKAHERKVEHDAEADERQKKLTLKPSPTQSVLSAIDESNESPAQKAQQRVKNQADRWNQKGADPVAVARWRSEQMQRIADRENADQAKNQDRLRESEYQSHSITLQAYRSYLEQRLGMLQASSLQWNQVNARIQNLDSTAARRSIDVSKEQYKQGLIDASQYRLQLAAIMSGLPQDSAISLTAQRETDELDSKASKQNVLIDWASEAGDSISRSMGRSVDDSISHWKRFKNFHHELWHDVAETGRQALGSGAGSLVKSGISGITRSLFGGFFGDRRFEKTSLQSSGIWSERSGLEDSGIGKAIGSADGIGGSLKTLPQMLSQLKSGFSRLLTSLSSGFGRALIGMQSLLALSGAEGKRKQKHSLLGGILGGIAGLFVGNLQGGFSLGSALGGAFASGGQMNLSKFNMVGERGPEIVAPGGFVIPMRSAGRGGSPSRSAVSRPVSVTVNHYGDIHGGDDVTQMYNQIPQAVVNALPAAKAGI